MTQSESKIIFEHPLNEKMRTWLRIEFLFKQLHPHKVFNNDNALLFFRSLSELLEITERNDIRADLLKELEQQKQKLQCWLNVEGVNTALLSSILERLSALAHELNTHPCIGQELKDNKFISSIRQRLAIPGGCCCFDLPSLHFWLHLSQVERNIQMENWISCFSSLHDTLTTCMQLIRQSSVFKPYACINNFYHDKSNQAELLRIRIASSYRIYPQVSGHQSRYAIRFFPFNLDTPHEDRNVEFELACC
ncbi:MAG: cell division protein ZapD [Candidatus Schmidhempelia sp.]|nr:cell division protein ZapD [Candidatus Schmidhempelia sp.]